MRRKIPGIEALMAFEAAARWQSFARAAEEVARTQSAVGRQVALLEAYLGVRLFHRVRQRVRLTSAGATYAQEIREDLNRIERHTRAAIAAAGAKASLDLAVAPTFATGWLIPRLPQFHARHRDIILNLSACNEPLVDVDGCRQAGDAAIHLGDPDVPGLVVEYLFGEELIPVCSAALLAGRAPLQPGELAQQTLLHSAARPDAWRRWFARAGMSDDRLLRGPRYEPCSMLVQAARATLGVALVPRFLVREELAARELVIAAEPPLPGDEAYYLVYAQDQRSRALHAFTHWLVDAARDERRVAG